MRPLSYQCAEHSCWVTSMINGIRCVDHTDTVDTRVYKKLHRLLKADGVYYYTKQQKKKFRSVIEEVAYLSELRIHSYFGNQVVQEIGNLNLERSQAAVCDVGDGDHSILLTGKEGNWFKAFDPWFYPRNSREPNNNVKFLCEDSANVKIGVNHLISGSMKDYKGDYGKGKAYPMGERIHKHALTVMERKN